MRQLSKSVLLIPLAFVYILNAGCANIFSEMADKTNDKSLLYETKKQLGRGEWDTALAQIELMSDEYKARRDILVLKASAYAGKSGLDFVDLAVAMQDTTSTSLFAILLTARSNGNHAHLNNSIIAENLLKGIGSESTRTAEENLLMAFIALVKMGNILNITGNKDGDTSFDAGWNTCGTFGESSIPNINAATRADMTELVTGLAQFLVSLTAAGAGDSAGEFFADLDAICASAGGACTITERADVTSVHTKAMRALMGGSDAGVGLGLNACSVNDCLATVCFGN